jgi:hypothetical protein
MTNNAWETDMTKNSFLIFAAVILTGWQSLSFSLDATANAFLSDRYYYRFINDPSSMRLQYDVNLSQPISDNLNVSFSLWNSERTALFNGGFTIPEELDYILTGSYSGETFGGGLIGTLYTTSNTVGELGGYFDYFWNPGIDVLSVTAELAVYSDFRGFYQELKLEPTLSLPLSTIITVTLPVTLGLTEGNFFNLNFTGITGLNLAPKVGILFENGLTVSLQGGYYFSFMSGNPSYPFVTLKVGFRFSTDKKEDSNQ